MKNKIIGLLLGSSMLSIAVADNAPVLNTISYQLQAKQWVAVNSAEITVSVNATVKDQALNQLQDEIIGKLNQMVTGEKWHVVDFQINPDPSGLQTLSWRVNARIPWQVIHSVQQKISLISQKGQKYNIENISFTPSAEEKQQAMAQLRQNIYAQVKKEMMTLNSEFPNNNYFVHNISFASSQPVMGAMQNNMQSMVMMKMPYPQQSPMGRELSLDATVEVGTIIK